MIHFPAWVLQDKISCLSLASDQCGLTYTLTLDLRCTGDTLVLSSFRPFAVSVSEQFVEYFVEYLECA